MSTPPSPARTSDSSTTAPYLLYAEDNPTDYLFFRRAFSTFNDSLRVVHRADGSLLKNYLVEAVERNAPLPLLVVLDIKMPGMTGLEVLEFIREHPRLRLLPVVVLSASDQERDIIRAYDNEVNAYLVKPDRYHQLKDLVCSLDRFWIRHNQVAA